VSNWKGRYTWRVKIEGIGGRRKKSGGENFWPGSAEKRPVNKTSPPQVVEAKGKDTVISCHHHSNMPDQDGKGSKNLKLLLRKNGGSVRTLPSPRKIKISGGRGKKKRAINGRSKGGGGFSEDVPPPGNLYPQKKKTFRRLEKKNLPKGLQSRGVGGFKLERGEKEGKLRRAHLSSKLHRGNVASGQKGVH